MQTHCLSTSEFLQLLQVIEFIINDKWVFQKEWAGLHSTTAIGMHNKHFLGLNKNAYKKNLLVLLFFMTMYWV